MIDLKNIELDNKKIFLIILVSLLVFYLDYNFLIQAQRAGIKKRGEEVIKLDKDLANLNRDLVKMQEAKGKEGLANKAKRFIRDEEKPTLLKDISILANNNGIEIMQVQPIKEEMKAGKEPINFTPFLVKLDLVCDYHSLGKFINDLEKAEVFMAIEEIKISAGDKDYLKQRANLLLKTYVKK